MATRLFLHSATNTASDLPTASQSSLLPATITVDTATLNRSMDLNIGLAQTSLVATTNATTDAQKLYFCRFVSPPLEAQTIPANTWTINVGMTKSASAANFPVNTGPAAIPIVFYVWRPGTGKVGSILEGNSDAVFTEVGTANDVITGTFAGSSITVQKGDVLVYEVWYQVVQGGATSRSDTLYFDGTTVTLTNLSIISNHAAFLETPDTLTFTYTRFYLHNAANAL